METVICSRIVNQFLPLASSFCIHLSMTPFGSRGLSHSVWTEREVRATGRGGGWRAGGAAEVWSSVTGPRLQHCLTVRTDRTEMCRHLSGWFRWTRGPIHTFNEASDRCAVGGVIQTHRRGKMEEGPAHRSLLASLHFCSGKTTCTVLK